MRKMFQSPIYTTNPHHLKLYDYIRQFYPMFDSPRLKHETVFEKVYQGQPFNEKKLWDLVTGFTRLTEEYLILLDNRQNAFQCKRQLTRIYGQRNLFGFFEKNTKGLLADLEASPYRGMNYYLQRAQLNEDWYFHPMKNKYDLKDRCLEDLINSVDQYFMLAKMRFGIAAKNVESILAKRYDLRFLKAVETEENLMNGAILYQLYQLTYRLITEKKEIYFEEVEKLLFDEMDTLKLEDKQLLFYTNMNFIYRQMNKGNASYSKKAFSWNQFGLEHGLFLENQKMNENIFGNIVITGCREKEFVWTKDFIESNQRYLDLKTRDDVANYNLGLLYFYQKDFNRAIGILNGFPFSSSYLLKTRLTLIRATFENFLLDRDHFSVLNYQVGAFEATLLRSKVFSATSKKPYLNTVRLIKKLANKIMDHNSKETIEKWFRGQLDSKRNVIAKGWMLEKVASLK